MASEWLLISLHMPDNTFLVVRTVVWEWLTCDLHVQNPEFEPYYSMYIPPALYNSYRLDQIIMKNPHAHCAEKQSTEIVQEGVRVGMRGNAA